MNILDYVKGFIALIVVILAIVCYVLPSVIWIFISSGFNIHIAKDRIKELGMGGFR